MQFPGAQTNSSGGDYPKQTFNLDAQSAQLLLQSLLNQRRPDLQSLQRQQQAQQQQGGGGLFQNVLPGLLDQHQGIRQLHPQLIGQAQRHQLELMVAAANAGGATPASPSTMQQAHVQAALSNALQLPTQQPQTGSQKGNAGDRGPEASDGSAEDDMQTQDKKSGGKRRRPKSYKCLYCKHGGCCSSKALQLHMEKRHPEQLASLVTEGRSMQLGQANLLNEASPESSEGGQDSKTQTAGSRRPKSYKCQYCNLGACCSANALRMHILKRHPGKEVSDIGEGGGSDRDLEDGVDRQAFLPAQHSDRQGIASRVAADSIARISGAHGGGGGAPTDTGDDASDVLNKEWRTYVQHLSQCATVPCTTAQKLRCLEIIISGLEQVSSTLMQQDQSAIVPGPQQQSS